MPSYMVNVSNNVTQNILLAIAISVMMIGLAVDGTYSQSLFRFEYGLMLEDGQWFRMLTGHYVHLSWRHLALNLCGFAFVFALFIKNLHHFRLLGMLVAYPLGISSGLLCLHSIDWYVGFSGVLYGFLTWGILRDESMGLAWRLAIVVFLILKIVWDAIAGTDTITEQFIGGAVVWQAHAFGCFLGLLQVSLEKVCGRYRKP